MCLKEHRSLCGTPPWHTVKFIWMWSPQLQIHLLFPLHILLVCHASPLAYINTALYFSIINFWHEVALNMANTESNWYVKQGKHNESHVQMRLAPAAELDWNRIQNRAANFSKNFFTKSPASQAVPRPLLYLWYIQPQFNGWNDFEVFPVEPIFTLCEYKLQPFSKEFSLVIS